MPGEPKWLSHSLLVGLRIPEPTDVEVVGFLQTSPYNSRLNTKLVEMQLDQLGPSSPLLLSKESVHRDLGRDIVVLRCPILLGKGLSRIMGNQV